MTGNTPMQPPSGGCVLKPSRLLRLLFRVCAAAFGRLCVETGYVGQNLHCWTAAAFGRLCVETRGS